MAFASEYYIRLQGKQKGPYTYGELKRLYDRNLLAGETLYWREGMEQSMPVAELCETPQPRRWKRLRDQQFFIFVGVILIATAIVAFAPLCMTGWKEFSQHQFTPQSAYWKARGCVRNAAAGKKESVSFDPFAPQLVQLSPPVNAVVTLPCVMFPPKGAGVRARWEVALRFDPQHREWRPASLRELAP